MDIVKHILKFNKIEASYTWSSIIRPYFVLVFILAFLPSTLLAKDISILVLDHSDKSFSKELYTKIKSKIHNKHREIKINKKNILDQPDLDKLSEHDLIITLGNKSAEYILTKNPITPVLSLLITKRAIRILEKSLKPSHPWITISLDQPIKRQLLLIKNIIGHDITIGTIFGPASKIEKHNVIKLSNESKLKLVHEQVDITDQLISALKNLISKSNVIFAIPDPVTFNKKTIRGILLLTYRKGIPVIGFSQSYVKAGALASVYSNTNHITQQSSEIIFDFIENNNIKSENKNPKYFSLEINRKVERALNLNPIDDNEIIEIIKLAEDLK